MSPLAMVLVFCIAVILSIFREVVSLMWLWLQLRVLYVTAKLGARMCSAAWRRSSALAKKAAIKYPQLKNSKYL